MLQIAQVLKAHMGAAARKVPVRTVPGWLLRLVALVDAEVKGVLPELGKCKNASNEKARRLLGWQPKSPQEAILATAQSLLSLNLLTSR